MSKTWFSYSHTCLLATKTYTIASYYRSYQYEVIMAKERAQYINSVSLCSIVSLQYVLLMLTGLKRKITCLLATKTYTIARSYSYMKPAIMAKKRAQYINSVHICSLCSIVPLQYVLLMLTGLKRKISV